jgi:DNA-binding MarR family transcriptional regulator
MADFRYAIRRYLNFSEQAARASGLEPQQYQALLALKGMPPLQKATIGALAERLQVRHHSAVELFNRLEANHWVRRYRSRSDRREVLLRLAQRGERRLQQLAFTHRAELHSAGRTLIRALDAILAHSRGRRNSPLPRAPGAPGPLPRILKCRSLDAKRGKRNGIAWSQRVPARKRGVIQRTR